MTIVYVGDFGPANKCDVAETTKLKAGTPGFQISEQLKSEGVSAKSDVYAFAEVLTELYKEMSLWPKITPHQIMFNVAVNGVYPETARLPLPTQGIVKLCLIHFLRKFT